MKTRPIRFQAYARSPGRAGWGIGLLIVLAGAAEGRADLLISTPSFSAAQGSSGSFEVVLTNRPTVGGPSYNVAGFDAEVDVDGASGITFTGFFTPTSRYIFNGISSGEGDILGPTSVSFYDNGTFDFGSSRFNSTTVNPGDSYVLGVIGYSIAANASTSSPISLTVNRNFSGLFDPEGTSLPFDVSSGSVTAHGAPPNAVPEPSTLLLTALAAVPLTIRAGLRKCRIL